MWGVDRGDGNNHLHMVCCYNEECFRDLQDRRALWNQVFPFNYSERLQIEVASPVTAGGHRPVSELRIEDLPRAAGWQEPEAQAAICYLLSRGFDIGELYEHWGVYVASRFDRSTPVVSGRLVIPVRQRVGSLLGSDRFPLVGWQARVVGVGRPKYLSMAGLSKSQVLYGIERAACSQGPLVVVEGPTDVWRFGSDAVAILGKSASDSQVEQLVTQFPNRVIAVALDRDAGLDANELARRLRSGRRDWGRDLPVFVVPPPSGANDFGECSRDAAWRQVHIHTATAIRHGESIEPASSSVQREIVI